VSRLLVPVSAHDHVAGSRDAPVVLVEYGDYECPYCGRAHPIVKAAQRSLGEQLAFVYRHFPLAEVHPHATLAAEAAEAAGAQGKFWAMHDMLFDHQTALQEEALLVYAEAVKLDVARWAQELADGAHSRKVRDDFLGGVRSGVNGTPTFFINGVRFDGNWADADGFIAVLELVATTPHTEAIGRS
jgi:protein-disulfide isomerase